MKRGNRFVAIGLSAMLAVTFMPVSSLAAEEKATGNVEEATDHLEEVIAKSQKTDIYDYVGTFSESGEEEKAQEASKYPSVFDLSDGRITGVGSEAKNVITSVKFQNPYGTCWGFAAIAAAEGSIISESVDDKRADKDQLRETLNLSEKHLAWFANGMIEDESDSQYGEGVIWAKKVAQSEHYNTGGTAALATGLFSSGVGPVREDRVVDNDRPELLKYQGANLEKQYKKMYDKSTGKTQTVAYCYSDEDDWSIPYDYRYYQSYKLEQSFVLPSPAGKDKKGHYEYNEAGTNAIKDQLLQGRPVAIGFQADTASPSENKDGEYINLDTWSHYTYKENTGANHAVTIVGYDDNYSKENFNEGHQPEADGAFLVKNSWGASENDFPNKGPGWGIEVDGESTGYFWLSYYDKSLDMVEAYDFDLDNEGDREYFLDQYDNCNEQFPNNDTSEELMKSANVFTAEVTEKLFSVGCQTASPNTEVTYDIYILNDNPEGPEDGYLAASVSEVYEYGGYHKCQLNEDVIVQKGQKYSIVVTQVMADSNYAVFENAVYNENAYKSVFGDDATYWGHAVINENESFIYRDGEWSDFAEEATVEEDDILEFDNFPIKGYAEKCADIQMRASSNAVIFNKIGRECKVSVSFKGNADALTDDSITWESADDSVAHIEPYVDKKGNSVDTACMIQAKDIGSTYVIARNSSMGIVVIKVTVNSPGEVEITSAKVSGKALVVKWDEEASSEGYVVKYGPVGEKAKTAYINDATKTEFKVASPKKNVKYRFDISGYSCNKDGKKVFGKNTTVYVVQPPKSTSIKSIKAGKKAFKVKWAKSTCDGYEVAYSTSKSMKKAKIKTIKKGSKTSLKISKLKSGKKYYVKIRAYNKAGKKVAYSSWSKAKTIKTK